MCHVSKYHKENQDPKIGRLRQNCLENDVKPRTTSKPSWWDRCTLCRECPAPFLNSDQICSLSKIKSSFLITWKVLITLQKNGCSIYKSNRTDSQKVDKHTRLGIQTKYCMLLVHQIYRPYIRHKRFLMWALSKLAHSLKAEKIQRRVCTTQALCWAYAWGLQRIILLIGEFQQPGFIEPKLWNHENIKEHMIVMLWCYINLW